MKSSLLSLLPLFLIFQLISGCIFSENDSTNNVSVSITGSQSSNLPIIGVQVINVNEEWLAAPEISKSNSSGKPIQLNLDNSRPHILKFAAPGYRPLYTFLNSGFENTEIDVQLSPSVPTPELNPTIRGNFNNFDGRSAVPMEKNSNGLWEATIVTDLDTIQYVVSGVHFLERVPGADGEIVINESAQGFDQNFVTEIIKPSDQDSVIVRFDPSVYNADPMEYSISLSGDKTLGGVAKLYTRSLDEFLTRLKENQLHFATGNNPPFEHDYAEYLDDIKLIKQQFNDPEISIAAELVKYRFSGELSSSDFESFNLFEKLDSDSPLWMLSYGAVSAMSNKYPFEETESYLTSITDKSPFELLKGEALFNLIKMYKAEGDKDNWHAAFFELVSKYPDHYTVNHAYQNYAPEQPISEGNPLPFEEFNRLDESGTFNLDDLEQDYILLDFWATWCGPCISAMPKLHEVQDQFSDNNFTIVSISLDDNADLVESFRDDWEMPWVHGIESSNSTKIREMGVAGVPYYILLGPDRNVLNYNQTELRSDKLSDIIGNYLD